MVIGPVLLARRRQALLGGLRRTDLLSIDQLPADATWEDLMREIYVRAAIEKGLEDSRSGRTKEVSEIRAKYGLAG